MSYEIEFDRKVFEFKGYDKWGNRQVQKLLFVNKRGSSNVTNHDGSIVRDWGFTAIGTERDVISSIARYANEIEGGMLRYQNGETKTENYIRNWRNEPRVPITEFGDHFRRGEITVHHPSDINDVTEFQEEILHIIKDEWRRTSESRNDTRIIKYHKDMTKETIQQADVMSNITSITMDLREV